MAVTLIWQKRSKDLKPIGSDAVDFIIGGITGLLGEGREGN